MVHVLYLRIQLWTSVKDINICRLIFWLRCRLLILCLTSLYQKRKRSSNKATYWWQRERNRAERRMLHFHAGNVPCASHCQWPEDINLQRICRCYSSHDEPPDLLMNKPPPVATWREGLEREGEKSSLKKWSWLSHRGGLGVGAKAG